MLSFRRRLQAHLGDIVGSVPGRCNKESSANKSSCNVFAGCGWGSCLHFVKNTQYLGSTVKGGVPVVWGKCSIAGWTQGTETWRPEVGTFTGRSAGRICDLGLQIKDFPLATGSAALLALYEVTCECH